MSSMEESIDARLVAGLVSNLMAADNKRMANMLDELIDANDACNSRFTEMCFRHREIVYYHQEYRPRSFNRQLLMTPSLIPDLYDQFEVIERECLILKEHTQKIKQILTILLKGVRDHQMLRDLLPDCMAQYVVPHKERHMPQHLVWKLTDRQIREYREVLPLIQMYSASSILL